jgi:hypothetical protein
MRRTIPLIAAALALAYQCAYAQPQGSAVVTSEPGKASAVRVIEATATVVAINAATRTVTVKNAQGKTRDIVCGDEVKNFAQIHVGDQVSLKYQEALSLELKKVKAEKGATVMEASARAEPGAKPAGAVGRQVTILADVVAVDPKKSTISLKGPAGNVVELDVQNPAQFKVVKKGDQVEAVYTEALAIAVTPAPKAEPKKPAAKSEAKK